MILLVWYVSPFNFTKVLYEELSLVELSILLTNVKLNSFVQVFVVILYVRFWSFENVMEQIVIDVHFFLCWLVES